MALDGLVVRAIVHELQACAGGKINKIYQPTEQDIVMFIRSGGQNYKLLLSASPTYPRIQLTDRQFVNPVEAPMFCMLLRKHCENGTIEAISQVGNERIVHIDVRQRDELGDVSVKRIVMEIMGRHSNLILMDPASGTVLDGIHHITPAISSHRVVLPGVRYVEPPQQGKQNPFEASEAEIVRVLEEAVAYDAAAAGKAFVDAYTGISPLAGQAIAAAAPAGASVAQAAAAAFMSTMQRLREHRYDIMIKETGKSGKMVFSVVPLVQFPEEPVRFDTISDCLEQFYGDKSERDLIKQRTADLSRFLQNEIQKNEKKIVKLRESYEDAKDADRFRKLGELLTASLHTIQKGDTKAAVIDYYDEAQSEIEIPLDPLLNPSENAQRYFKKYNKAKTSLTHIEEQLQEAEEENGYFRGLLLQLEDATLNDIGEIREELTEGGYLRARAKKTKKKKKDGRPALTCFISSEGVPIFVGKNNTQNDYLTLKFAAAGETWLHTKDIPGSHVLIRGASFGDSTLEEAAELAAYFSQAKHSSSVPVDYTLARHVRKPNGAKPGFVIYDHQKTVYVTPDEAKIKAMKSELK
ncbi:Rqc2 family fibronectin-binding protein [Paenibacillus turpanensis]|uniref:Rqc2 family fibronectin-binding protein n=1 Tax=Paenibacillus turpanensis TaxID=2689078 RepID=UPI00140CD012|nr:NFACT RNA binding domain-containing protein [Paenibacillus turpanensis]